MVRLSYKKALEFLYSHIPDRKRKFPGEFGLLRATYFFNLIGNPQNKLKIIHVAGTSGKGSTAFYISQLLESQGFKAGLTLSPHLIDIRERCQINNQLISKKEFTQLMKDMMPAIKKMNKTQFGAPTYFEILIGLFFLSSLKNRVDYAIVETGLGGLYDATNTVKRNDKLCIITRIGFDHTEILGNTLEKIAEQKAGIMQAKNTLITFRQGRQVRRVFEKKVEEMKGKLIYTDTPKVKKPEFDFESESILLKNIRLSTNALYQIENCCLALATLFHLSKRDNFNLDEKNVLSSLARSNFRGRMEQFYLKGKTVVIDGAHNPQKMGSFINSFKKIQQEKSIFLVAFKTGKDYQGMLDKIMPVASKIIITSYSVDGFDSPLQSEKGKVIQEYLDKNNFLNNIYIADSRKALKELLKEKSSYLIITGSLYLLSEIYPSLMRITK